MRHLSLVEWRARSGVSHESPILRQSRQLKFNVHGEVQRPSLRRHRLPQVDAMGENLTQGARSAMGEQELTKRINELVLEYKASAVSIDEFLRNKLASARKNGKKCAEAAISALTAIDENYAKLQKAKTEGKNRQEWLRGNLEAAIEVAGADKKRDVVGMALFAATEVIRGNPPQTKSSVQPFEGIDAVDAVANLDEAFLKASIEQVAMSGKEES